MKNKMIKIAVFGLVIGFSSLSFADTISEFIDAIETQSKEAFCAKASFFDFKFSIRSGEGAACKIPLIAAYTESICYEAASDYKGSGCNLNALEALKQPGLSDRLLQALASLAVYPTQIICRVILSGLTLTLLDAQVKRFCHDKIR